MWFAIIFFLPIMSCNGVSICNVIFLDNAGSTVGSGNMIVPPTYSSSGLHGAGAMSPAGEL